MQYVLPDYRNCGMNVAAAVLKHFGAPCTQEAHPVVWQLLQEKKYKNIVLMLFDGMGMATLGEHLQEDSFLRSHVAQRMTAVFPSTTVAATTSIESGEAPCEHAWLGWSLYFKELDRIVDVFPNRDTLTGERLEGEISAAERLIPYRSISKKLNDTGKVRAQIVSHFGDIPIDTLDDLFDTARRLCAAEGRQYIYTYWGEPDHTIHNEGVMAVGDIMRDIDARVADFCAQAGEDTLVLATADHGLLDAEVVYLSDYPQLLDACERYFHVEGRAASFYVKPEYHAQFPDLVAKTLGGDDFLVLTARQVMDMGLLGTGKVHPYLANLLGDYWVIALGKRSLIRRRGDMVLLGMHAGLSEREMYVPLIVGKK